MERPLLCAVLLQHEGQPLQLVTGIYKGIIKLQTDSADMDHPARLNRCAAIGKF